MSTNEGILRAWRSNKSNMLKQSIIEYHFPGRKMIFKQLFSFSMSTALAQLIMMIISITLARHLGPELSGRLTSPYAITTLTAIIFNLGLDTWFLREGAFVADQKSTLGKIIRVKGIGGIIWLIILIAISAVIRPDLFVPQLMLLVALDIWTDAIFTTVLVGFNLNRWIKQYSILLLISRIGKLAGIVVLILLKTNNLLFFAGWRFFISAIMMLITLLITKPKFSRSYGERSILKDARPYALSELLAIIYMQVDVNILYFFRGAFAVGTYSPALNMTNALFVIPNAVFNFVVPSLTRLYTHSRMAFLRKCKEVLLLMLAIGVALAAGLSLLSRPLTQFLLGEQYSLSGVLLLGLSPILLFKSLEYGFATIIVAAKEQRRRLVPQLLAAVLNLLINFILIPLIAANGAVIAYVVTEAVLLVGYGIVAVKLLIGARNGK